MSLSAITQPHSFMAAYSAVPLKLSSTEFTKEQFRYLVNVVWDKVIISADTSINFNTEILTKLTSTTAHNFKVGDTVLIDDSINNDKFTGYYIVQAVLSPTTFAIDLIPNAPFDSSGFTCSKVLKWKLNPDLEGYGKLDMATSLKDFVSQNLTGETIDYGLTYNGKDTKFNYEIYCGNQEIYNFRFDFNFFSNGFVGFVATGLTSTADVPFQVGDSINIEQDIFEWPYFNNYSAAGNVGFTGSTFHSFLPGQQVTITGQKTFPYYNGQTTIQSVGLTNIVTVKGYQGLTPFEAGFVYGVPRPEYNRTCNVVSIQYVVGQGVQIVTDIPFTLSSVPIGGTIRYADGRISEFPTKLKLSGKTVYNAHIDKKDYSLTSFDKYVIQNRAASGNNFSTILTQGRQYRIEKSTIGFLLAHSNQNIYDGAYYTFFDKNNSSLGVVRIVKSNANELDSYFPIGLEQISKSNYTNVTNAFSGYSGDVLSYNTFVYYTLNIAVTNTLSFRINDDCSKYEIYHLMWKDALGSFISYPFKYVSRDNVEVERQTYYKQEGTWDNNTFGYYDYGNGEKNFYIKSRKSFILNSGWLKEYERNLIEDLFQSASVYIQTPDNRLFQCHLSQKEIEIYKDINEQLFSYTFNVRVSNNEYRF